MASSSPSSRVLNIDNINAHVREAQYAVRGVIPQRAEKYKAQIAKGEGKDLPFDNVIFANIGNPQQLDQKPITFFRQVASLLEYPPLMEQPELLEKLGYKSDAIARAKTLLKEVNSVGAYSNSSGAAGIKQSVANFIERKWLFYLGWQYILLLQASKTFLFGHDALHSPLVSCLRHAGAVYITMVDVCFFEIYGESF